MTAPALLQEECSEQASTLAGGPTLVAVPPLTWEHGHGPLSLPCHEHDADLWFAEQSQHLERAKAYCQPCPVREACLAQALERCEPWGVWGGQILLAGQVVAVKRGRGRPRKVRTDDAA